MSDRWTKKTIIDGLHFTTRLYGGKEALKLKMEIVSKIGPALAIGLKTLEDNPQIDELEPGILSMALEKLFNNLPPNAMMGLIERIFENTYVKAGETDGLIGLNTETGFDTAFRGNTVLIYKVVPWVLEQNYPDIFTKLPNFFGMVREDGNQTQKTITTQKE